MNNEVTTLVMQFCFGITLVPLGFILAWDLFKELSQ